MESLSPTDISTSLMSDIKQNVAAFSIGLVRISTDRADAELLGSGTLVQVLGKRAILTAHHVLEVLPKSGELGLVLSSNAGAPTVSVEALKYLQIDRGLSDEAGPDLGAIVLPPIVPSSLAAKKSFLNLTVRRERMLNGPPAADNGLWCLCGLQSALTEDSKPAFGFTRVKRFRGFCPVGGVEVAPPVEMHDYFTFPIPHGKGSPLPDRIGGTSGGGLWQCLLSRAPDGSLEVSECLFSGLAFYQGPIDGGWSPVRCHGRKSIYGAAYDAIAAAQG
ncbi:hypothetical protein [Mesorhizobium sp.]|uniref:hypothetical protein n=1 Tax=Mesorhizobium sp. TaxID=1871066 RepID=UPI000FE2E329|nr:hypothetical protein [Mesorhizobium sp.]RWN52716.1 MAG: hypothetical protein EOR98_20950 [Mesorhizobium sp.]RWN78431.1 MAG: hypothetical protein EOS01_16565 [Mesorhizobium sp.]RWN81035.1 MAG: hypothetical protein EOS02_03935 [Mesorhizobium sp.]RWN85826.1 MAG: hypothetical protein EOS04_21150 [Mesorhizobium sp.]RWO16251.1 MAG: hypothetical protein EOS15_04440 [Mesorhizobium sp.]